MTNGQIGSNPTIIQNSPQGFTSPNYTQVPNDLFDALLPTLGGVELKVVLVIIRKTFGWHKVRDRISLSQLQEMTGCKRDHIIKAANSLHNRGIIKKEIIGENGSSDTYYELVFNNCEEVRPVPKKGPPQSPKRDPQKKRYKRKKTIDRFLLKKSSHQMRSAL